MVEAANLPATDDNGSSDPYCLIKVGRTVKKTSVQFKDVNPKWNEEFTLQVKAYDNLMIMNYSPL